MNNLSQKDKGGFLLNTKMGDSQKAKYLRHKQYAAVSDQWDVKKKRVQEAIKLYRKNLNNLSRVRKSNPKPENGTYWTDHLKAVALMEDKRQCVNTSRRFGKVPGISIGDEFLWRGEMKIIGLHYQIRNGIDYLKTPFGKQYATSIVDSGRYDNNNNVGSPDSLVYCGQGENPTTAGNGKLKDQKLDRGNLALKNNMEGRVPVRVIRKIGCANDYKYVYDGLYSVERFWQERGEFGKLVFKFLLKRIPEHNWAK